jgi:hypothetical protein
MLKESEAVRLLKSYLDNQARLKLLEIELINTDIFETIEAKALQSTNYDVPGSKTNKFHSRVEDVVFNRRNEVCRTKEQLKRDIIYIKSEILKVDIMLSRLCYEDRFLIEQKFFSDKSLQGWKAIAREHSIKFNKDFVLNWKTIKWRVKNKIIPFLDRLL